MTTPTPTEFLARFPEFGELTLTVVEGAIAEAARATPASQWGTVHTEAVSNLAAHLLSTRVMQIGLQVGSQPFGAGGLEASLYGQEYERLKGTLPISGFAL
jgi:ABC-type methionine transport system permease subunit